MKNSKSWVDVTFGTNLWVKTCFSFLTKVGSKSLGRNKVSTFLALTCVSVTEVLLWKAGAFHVSWLNSKGFTETRTTAVRS